MPQAIIENHELWKAWEAVGLESAGFAELATFAHYDVDPLADDAEQRIIETIEDCCACDYADNARRAA